MSETNKKYVENKQFNNYNKNTIKRQNFVKVVNINKNNFKN